MAKGARLLFPRVLQLLLGFLPFLGIAKEVIATTIVAPKPFFDVISEYWGITRGVCVDVLLVQEPPLALLVLGRWRGFRAFFAQGPNPSVLILVHMGLRASQFDIQGDRVCGVEIHLEIR